MVRPIKQRTAKSYKRDIECLNRLRMAIKLDHKQDQNLISEAVINLDRFMDTLMKLVPR